MDFTNFALTMEKKSPYSPMEHKLSESSSDTYSDSSRYQSAPGDDENLILSPLQIYSDSSRDQSVPRDNEPWSLGVRQRVTSWNHKVFSVFWIVTYLALSYNTVVSIV
jgi:hypothetical protein